LHRWRLIDLRAVRGEGEEGEEEEDGEEGRPPWGGNKDGVDVSNVNTNLNITT
jgi:hypothetical protein